MSKSRPNIVVLIADDHRYESLGCNGGSEVPTPHLDALATRGVVFDGAHCQGGMHPAVCVPSRASLMTGRNIFASSLDPTGDAYEGAAFAIPPHLETFPERMRAAGYATHAVGKWHNDRASFARSFSSGDRLMFAGMSGHDSVPLRRFDPSGLYPDSLLHHEAGFSTDLFRDAALAFLESRDRSTPFCLYVAFTAPHDPRTPPPNHARSGDTVSLPSNYLPVHPFDNGEMLVRDEKLEAFPREPGRVRQHVADYYGMISHLDEAIGAICARLDDDTIIVYTADHGLALGQHGLMGKQNLYAHSTHIPLMLAGPGIPAGRRLPHLVWHADTTATLLALAGLDSDPVAEGRSLLPLCRGEPVEWRETLTAAYRFSQRMVRDRRYKLIRYTPEERAANYRPDNTPTAGSQTAQFFDLERDPLEMVNLASMPEHREHIRYLSAALLDWQRRVGDPLLGAR